MGPLQPINRIQPSSVHLVDATGDRHGHSRSLPQPPRDQRDDEEPQAEDQPKDSSLDISV